MEAIWSWDLGCDEGAVWDGVLVPMAGGLGRGEEGEFSEGGVVGLEEVAGEVVDVQRLSAHSSVCDQRREAN